jgi:uncharacterized protein YndB with AHSA1/START domain
MNAPGKKRTDSASRIIAAPPQSIYRAFIDPDALTSWLPPQGMTGHMDAFDVRSGGYYRMTLTYQDAGHDGKTSENSDAVEGKFVELVPNEKVVQEVEFQSDDAAFAGTMTMTWSIAAVPGGSEVTILCENVPEGIHREDHDAGLKSSLDNLAAFTEVA